MPQAFSACSQPEQLTKPRWQSRNQTGGADIELWSNRYWNTVFFLMLCDTDGILTLSISNRCKLLPSLPFANSLASYVRPVLALPRLSIPRYSAWRNCFFSADFGKYGTMMLRLLQGSDSF